ncbi:kinase-like domain-containing protein [Gilbertella persicaria]|uniref:kinase-like domain-containing protein n=1 Tax=Gilbertella persicaria TaxID=101096 RepID=UPI0022212397|nr:kinase-like domain-containing protein [Gilbertella persicaria]KAI8078158.1 kinase-like domain-containing protein [Gilbertella persicaria]
MTMFTINSDLINHAESMPKPILVNSPTLVSSMIEPKKLSDNTKITLQLESTDQSHHQANMDDFEIKQPIGYGSSAIVYSATYIPCNKRVAIKIIDLDMFERNQIDELRRETALMALSKHPHILQVYGSFVHGSKLHIVTPYMAVGSCLDVMKLSFPDGLDEISIATILKQALEGLTYLHKNGHIHRDVKAGNLLMDQDGSVLLADFGVSSSLMETGEKGVRKTFVGTPCWMAPEVMEQADYDYKADIWSFGITAIELATGHAPFAKLSPLKVLMMTLNNDPPTLNRETATNKFSKVFKEMIDSCMHKDPLKRPTSEKLLQHPFFKQAKKPDWLAKNLIAEIPSIENRPTKKVPQKPTSTANTDEWDFNDDQGQQSNTNAPKRHISFGHVVVRKPSKHHVSSVSWSYSPSSDAASRKGRALSDDFILEPSQIANSRHRHQGSVPLAFPSDDKRSQMIKGRARHGSLHEKTPSVSFAEETTKATSDKLLYRTTSHDGNMNRKSQQHSPPPFPLHLQVNSLTRNNSSLKREKTTHSKKSLSEDLIIESRKVGRFELTSTDHKQYDTISSSSSTCKTAIYNQIDELLKQNDMQRQLLSELSSSFEPKPKPKPNEQLASTIEALEQQLQSYQRENLLLQRENETMRRQLELLKNK